MKTSSINIIIGVAILSVPNASAQDLSTEITLERTVLPEQRQAVRPSLMPTLISIETQEVQLDPAEYLKEGSVSSLLTLLPASPWGDNIPLTPYRGYARVGYFPTLNINGSAGYRFLDKERYKAGLWTQGSGTRYKYQGVRTEEGFATIGAYGSAKVGESSQLNANIDYTYSLIYHPWNQELDGERVNNQLVNIQALWNSHPGNINYYIGAGFDYIKMNKLDYTWCEPVMELGFNYNAPLSQQDLKFKAGVGLCNDSQSASWLGLDLNAQILSTDHGYGTLSQYNLRPYVKWDNESFYARVGVNLSIENGEKAEGTTIAPEVRLAYQPNGTPFSAWLTVTGGQELNTLRDLYLQNYYISPYLSYGSSNVIFDAEAALNIGRFGGFSFQILGGVAKADRWLMPALSHTTITATNPMQAGIAQWITPYGGTIMSSWDVLSWHAGVKVDFAYRNFLDVSVSVETGGSNHDQATENITWMRWSDRAKYVVNAAINVHPIEKLSLGVSYELRTDRKLPYLNAYWFDLNLANINNLNFSADYRVNNRLTVFMNLENLLCKHYLNTASLTSDGLHGLAGVSYKF